MVVAELAALVVWEDVVVGAVCEVIVASDCAWSVQYGHGLSGCVSARVL